MLSEITRWTLFPSVSDEVAVALVRLAIQTPDLKLTAFGAPVWIGSTVPFWSWGSRRCGGVGLGLQLLLLVDWKWRCGRDVL